MTLIPPSSLAVGETPDTLTLFDGGAPGITASVVFPFQTGTYTTGRAPSIYDDVVFPYTVTEAVTINGETVPVVISLQNEVNFYADTLTIFATAPVPFWWVGVALTVLPLQQAIDVPDFSEPLHLTAMLTPLPEPGSLAVVGLGGAGLAAVRRSRRR